MHSKKKKSKTNFEITKIHLFLIAFLFFNTDINTKIL